MLDAKYLTGDGWSDWEPCKLEWALKIASIYGNRSGDEFLFEDLPRGECEYSTGDAFEEFWAVTIKMAECPCEYGDSNSPDATRSCTPTW